MYTAWPTRPNKQIHWMKCNKKLLIIEASPNSFLSILPSEGKSLLYFQWFLIYFFKNFVLPFMPMKCPLLAAMFSHTLKHYNTIRSSRTKLVAPHVIFPPLLRDPSAAWSSCSIRMCPLACTAAVSVSGRSWWTVDFPRGRSCPMGWNFEDIFTEVSLN